MPIFVRTHDLLSWLLPASNHFPRAHRHTFTQRLLAAAFDLREHLETANLRRGEARMAQLQLADEDMARLKAYIRLAVSWNWLSAGQYQQINNHRNARCAYRNNNNPNNHDQNSGLRCVVSTPSFV